MQTAHPLSPLVSYITIFADINGPLQTKHIANVLIYMQLKREGYK